MGPIIFHRIFSVISHIPVICGSKNKYQKDMLFLFVAMEFIISDEQV